MGSGHCQNFAQHTAIRNESSCCPISKRLSESRRWKITRRQKCKQTLHCSANTNKKEHFHVVFGWHQTTLEFRFFSQREKYLRQKYDTRKSQEITQRKLLRVACGHVRFECWHLVNNTKLLQHKSYETYQTVPAPIFRKYSLNQMGLPSINQYTSLLANVSVTLGPIFKKS